MVKNSYLIANPVHHYLTKRNDFIQRLSKWNLLRWSRFSFLASVVWMNPLSIHAQQPTLSKNGSSGFAISSQISQQPTPESVQPKNSISKQEDSLDKLSIDYAIRLGKQNSPILKALRASVQSAQNSLTAIERTNRTLLNSLSPDLPFRQEQARKGLQAAEAELFQAGHDVTYNIVRTYYAAVYAKQQLKVADDLLVQLKIYQEFVEKIVKSGTDRKIDKKTEDTLIQYLAEAESKRNQAYFGLLRAIAGLQHELNLGGENKISIPDQDLPLLRAKIDQKVVVEHALTRRGEIALAQSGVDVLNYETLAQGSIKLRLRLPTAASVADIHSRTVPSGSRDGEYRPDALVPDYPSFLIGTKSERVARSVVLSERAGAVLEKTRELVRLEALNAYYRWQESVANIEIWKKAANAGRDLTKRIRDESENKFASESQLTAEGLAAQSIAKYNEALYQHLLELAALERATAGGLIVNYPGRQSD